jgi:hypothetical protein
MSDVTRILSQINDAVHTWEKPVARTDPTTGEKIKAKSTKWWGQYKDANGATAPASAVGRQARGAGHAQ